jgi:hypothetical protein
VPACAWAGGYGPAWAYAWAHERVRGQVPGRDLSLPYAYGARDDGPRLKPTMSFTEMQ